MKTEPINIEVGKIGEDIATEYLLDKGFSIEARNYRKKGGEIDIVARKDGLLHFVEVKTVSRENLDVNKGSYEYRPEENVHEMKAKRLNLAIQLYLSEIYHNDNTEWQFDVIALEVDSNKKLARLNFIKDLII